MYNLHYVQPFNLNRAHIPIDCVMTITERATGANEVICLGATAAACCTPRRQALRRYSEEVIALFVGGNCKTETVGVTQGVWMSPNADFVPIYSDKKCLTLKTYDRLGECRRLEGFCSPR